MFKIYILVAITIGKRTKQLGVAYSAARNDDSNPTG